jgi:hypothetical protein
MRTERSPGSEALPVSGNGRIATSVVVGLSTLLPWLAIVLLSRWPHAWRSTDQWAGALVLPATLAVAFLAAVLVRAFWRPARVVPLVALAAGATLGFFVGRTLVGPVFGLTFASRGIGVQVLVFLQVAVAAIAGAYASTRMAQASASRST